MVVIGEPRAGRASALPAGVQSGEAVFVIRYGEVLAAFAINDVGVVKDEGNEGENRWKKQPPKFKIGADSHPSRNGAQCKCNQPRVADYSVPTRELLVR